ncbi:hypothetical protein K458DRAFT_271609, partial [Lentithecium fluviatile CBS 122367]
MSYMLEFPPHAPLPTSARSPPYALFFVGGVGVYRDLPPKLPLRVALHLAPKLRHYIHPLSTNATYLALRAPHVGINIPANINTDGLGWIVKRMLQIGGEAVSKEVFSMKPSVLTSVSIHEAWLALELPLEGLQALHAHIQTTLSFGDPVLLKEIKAIWSAFPIGSPIMLEMGLNFVHSHINLGYTTSEFSSIRHWYLATRGRCDFFRSIEKQVPEFDQVQKL